MSEASTSDVLPYPKVGAASLLFPGLLSLHLSEKFFWSCVDPRGGITRSRLQPVERNPSAMRASGDDGIISVCRAIEENRRKPWPSLGASRSYRCCSPWENCEVPRPLRRLA
jgi:hypothetical protein